ncbi:MAG: Crossover junction endodeoxyribonuclease RuvC [Candidatus Levybacteria bacterium GW2011_GWB1_35_5]|nr:MAG: Crossover junction endodeoxyribonuclease RuvC [Candidatus Levybacteria bacterium GW2011_GWB1_35_5]
MAIIKKYKPEALAIEELFFNTNAKTAFIVGQARGVILLAASQNKLNISIYTPLQVKMAITGYGRAEKNQIGQMVKILLKLKTIPKPDDTADALAVALTHAFSAKMSKFKS